jgi:hypothetical protein
LLIRSQKHLKRRLFHLLSFAQAPGLLRASFLLELSSLCFHIFDLAPYLLGASFLPEHSYLRFRDFDLAPGLLGASFPLEHSYLCFCNFELAPSLWGGLCFLCVVLRSPWALIELDLPMALDVLVFSLSNANPTLLDILTCV